MAGNQQMKATPELWADHRFRMYAEAYERGLVQRGQAGLKKAQQIHDLIDYAKQPWELHESRAMMMLYLAGEITDLSYWNPTFVEWWGIYNLTQKAPDDVKNGRPVFEDHAGKENEDRDQDLPNRYPVVAALVAFLLGVLSQYLFGLF